MNNQGPFFNPFISVPNYQIYYDKLINHISKLEDDIKNLDKRISNLEKEKNSKTPKKPTDVYMIK